MKLRTLSLLISALTAGSLHVLATPLSSTVTSNVELIPGSTATDSNSWSGTPQEITSFVNLDDADVILAMANAYNLAPDGNSGTATLRAYWDLPAGTTYASAEGTFWEYSFVADATGDFVMNYGSFRVGDNTFGLNGFYLTGDLGNHFFNVGDNGQFVAGILNGFTYTIHLSVNANISGGNLDPYQGNMTGFFDWTMPGAASVPDAVNTAGMLALTVGGLAALRRTLARA